MEYEGMENILEPYDSRIDRFFTVSDSFWQF